MRLFLLFLITSMGLSFAQTTLIQNARIFDGVNPTTRKGHVLIVDGRIKQIDTKPIKAPKNAVVIDAQNRVLSPGFIDLHAHFAFQIPVARYRDHITLVGAFAAKTAAFYLDNGFTTVRDAGGLHPHFAEAINQGDLPGPRTYPSGAIVTQTAGHGDSRPRHDHHPVMEGRSPVSHYDQSILADGEAEFLRATRENLRNGATQIKIMGGGGVMSEYDPIHSLQPSPAEIRAAVQAAGDFDTYVLAHAYTSQAIRRLVDNGVKCIEHGLLMDDETARLVAQKNVAVSTQLVIFRTLQEMDGLNQKNLDKLNIVLKGQENLIALIKKHKILTGFGTDLIYGMYTRIGEEFTTRAQYWTPAEVLTQATSESARIIRMCGKMNRHGNFGEIREGWLADLILINGDPLQDISILADPAQAVPFIMQAGEVVKNKL